MEFVVGGIKYRSGRLNVMQQFHVARRLLPVFSSTSNLMQAGTGAVDGEAPPPVHLEAVLAPIAKALANLSDDDCNYVIATCASVVEREVGAGTSRFAAIWLASAKRFMYDDIDLPSMMQIVVEVLKDNISGFLAASNLPSTVAPSPLSN